MTLKASFFRRSKSLSQRLAILLMTFVSTFSILTPAVGAVQCSSLMSDEDCKALLNNWENWVPYTPSGDCNATGSIVLNGTDNISKAMNYFVGQKGLSPAQAAGIVGNFKIESGLNPAIQQDKSTDPTPKPNVGFGIAQWTSAGRQQGLVNLADKEGVPVNTLAPQLQYAWQELNGGYQQALDKLKQTTTANDAAVAIMIYYEAPAEHSPTGPNAQARSAAAAAILALYGSDATGGGSSVTISSASENGTCSGTTGGTSFKLSSFNICYSTYDPCNNRYGSWQQRLSTSVKIIQNQNLDVVGLQEVRPDQYAALKSQLGSSYGLFPKTYTSDYGSQNPIIYNSTKYKLVDQGSKEISGYTVTDGPKNGANTQIELQDQTTGQQFYVINEHEPVGNSASAIRWRTESAQNRAKYVKGLTDAPVFVTGDMNSKYSIQGSGNDVLGNSKSNLPYCILTDNHVLNDAYDADKGKSGTCPSYSYDGSVYLPPEGDHIYATPGVNLANYDYSTSNAGSDHHVLSVSATIPGSTADFGTGKGSFTTDTSKNYPGIQQTLARAKELSNNSSALFKTVCDGPSRCYHRCDHLVAGAWGHSSSGYETAMAHWAAMKAGGHGHPGSRNVPVGALLFYDTGEAAGHVALYLGNNKVLSNDVNGDGGAYIVDASAMESGPWRLTYLGWSDPVFG